LFLVRESTNFPGDYTLCVCFQSKVEHYRVKYLENKLTIDDEEYFENLGQLVAVGHQINHKDILLNIYNPFSTTRRMRMACALS